MLRERLRAQREGGRARQRAKQEYPSPGASLAPARNAPPSPSRGEGKLKSVTMPEARWSLHPQLASDTTPVGDLALSRLLAINDATYPWLVLVPRRAGVRELIDLSQEDAARLTEEVAAVSRVLKAVTRCDKLNVAAIGNVVPQLHVHIVARRKDDPLWPRPVWGLHEVQAGDEEAFGRFVLATRHNLRIPIDC